MLRLQGACWWGKCLVCWGQGTCAPKNSKDEKRPSGDFQDPSVQQLESHLHWLSCICFGMKLGGQVPPSPPPTGGNPDKFLDV